MKRLAVLAALSVTILGGCAVYPVGPGEVAVAPAPVYVGPPRVFIHGGYYHRPWRPWHHRHHHHHHWH